MSIAESPIPKVVAEPAVAEGKRLNMAEQKMLGKQLNDEVQELTGKVFGDKPETEKRLGEELVAVEGGMYRFGRQAGKVEANDITYIPNNPNDVSAQLKTARASWEEAPKYELTTWKGTEQPQVLEFNPNMTPNPVPGVDEVAFKACADFLAASQAEVTQASVPAVG